MLLFSKCDLVHMLSWYYFNNLYGNITLHVFIFLLIDFSLEEVIMSSLRTADGLSNKVFFYLNLFND